MNEADNNPITGRTVPEVKGAVPEDGYDIECVSDQYIVAWIRGKRVGGEIMNHGIVMSMTGVEVRETDIENAANKAIEAMLSELQEEAQTYDMLMYIIRRTKEKVKGAKITIRNR